MEKECLRLQCFANLRRWYWSKRESKDNLRLRQWKLGVPETLLSSWDTKIPAAEMRLPTGMVFLGRTQLIQRFSSASNHQVKRNLGHTAYWSKKSFQEAVPTLEKSNKEFLLWKQAFCTVDNGGVTERHLAQLTTILLWKYNLIFECHATVHSCADSWMTQLASDAECINSVNYMPH